ncbi:MAG: hypothetical protein VB022_03105 [Rikenellaceae bacterium]|nr:hypothetical protein [Rikenellaceae bacterium]
MENKNLSHRWSSVYKAGGVAAYLCVIIIITEIVFNIIVTINRTDTIALNAAGIFGEIKNNLLLGLYNLGFQNLILQIVLIPVFFAFYAAHRHSKVGGDSFLALLFFIIGTSVFISQNPALPFLELSNKFGIAVNDTGRLSCLAAGEAILAKGGIGSGSYFLAYLLISFAGLLISRVMFKGKVFNNFFSILGFIGNLLLIVYFTGVTFFPNFPLIVFSIAAPALFLILIWLAASGLKLIKLTIHN